MFYNVPETEVSLQFLGAAPYGAQVVAVGFDRYDSSLPDLDHPSFAQNPFPFHVAQPGDPFDFTTVAPVGITFMDPKFGTPYAFQYDFQVQYQSGRMACRRCLRG